jgi:hypothetical protein
VRRLDIDVSAITRMYVDERMSCNEIAKFVDASTPTIQRRLISAGVKLRSTKEAINETYVRGRTHPKKGTGCLNGSGYFVTQHKGRSRRMHVLLVESILGKELPKGAEVHHINGDRSDNRNSNLVVCPSHAYHFLLHRRQDAFDACGNASWLKCHYCGEHDDPKNLHVYGRSPKNPDSVRAYHRSCVTEYHRKRKQRIAQENRT